MLELHNVSPALLHSRDLDLGVPGTYSVSGSAVRIRNFGPLVAIIRSKQRPRKIKVYGEDGREFVFLLKGHEDLRQDERAMQLFGLVNALLFHHPSTGRESHDLTIQRYAVIPLSPTAGLISWVWAKSPLQHPFRPPTLPYPLSTLPSPYPTITLTLTLTLTLL